MSINNKSAKIINKSKRISMISFKNNLSNMLNGKLMISKSKVCFGMTVVIILVFGTFIPINNAQNIVSPIIAQANDYSAEKVIQYAEKYWKNYNPNYSNYNNFGGDCANYVSQCMVAGGLKMTSNWYWYSQDNHSASWTYCPSMYSYFKDSGYQIIENPTDSQVIEGNPVLYYSSEHGAWSHATMCIGHDTAGNALITAHNYNRIYEKWRLGTNWLKRCTIIVNGHEEISVSDFKFVSETGTVTKYTGDDENVRIPSEINEVPVTRIGYSAFNNCSSLKTVIIPESVQNISYYAFADCSDFETIKGVKGSYAETYAFEKGLSFIALKSKNELYVSGDINEDEKIDASDASQILRVYALLSTSGEIDETEEQLKAADVNNDGKVDASDASYVLRYYAYLSTITGTPVPIEDFIS